MTRSATISDTTSAAASGTTRHQGHADNPALLATGPAQRGGFDWAISMKRSLTGEQITAKHLLIVTSQLSVMLAAGCDLCAGLDALAKQQSHPTLKKVIADLH